MIVSQMLGKVNLAWLICVFCANLVLAHWVRLDYGGSRNSSFAAVEYHCLTKNHCNALETAVVGVAESVSSLSIGAQAACERSVLRQSKACVVAHASTRMSS